MNTSRSAERTGPRPARPQGREEIRAAVLRAGRELVAERGPDGFSVRAVAERAGINHALVHRHFGSKGEVLEQVLSAEADRIVAAVAQRAERGLARDAENVRELVDVLAGYPTYWRALVHAVLESPDVAVPGTAATTEVFRTLWAGTPPEQAVPTAVAGASVLGWLVFGDFISQATGADPDAVRRGMAEQVAALLPEPGQR